MNSVSVIIPTYNRARELAEAIRSVREQTHPATEILVVDDGSTDETGNLYQRMPAPIRYLRIEHAGVSAARNAGIRNAKGEWVAFLDSDDEWLPNKLARQFDCVRRTNAQVCFTGCATQSGERMDPSSGKDLRAGEDRFFTAPNELIFGRRPHPLLTSLLVCRRTLLETGLFDESLHVAEDTQLIYRLAYRNGVAYINESLVKVTRRRTIPGLSDNRDLRAIAVRFECYLRVQSEAYWRLLHSDPVIARQVKKNLGHFISCRAELASILGQPRFSRALAKEAIFLNRDVKSLVRGFLLCCAPGLLKPKLLRKWSSYQNQPAS